VDLSSDRLLMNEYRTMILSFVSNECGNLVCLTEGGIYGEGVQE
jgi:hypothetical protein